jgi:transposase-like protein
MKRQGRDSAEVRERAIWLVLEIQKAHGSPWPAITPVVPKLGYIAKKLRRWVQQSER